MVWLLLVARLSAQMDIPGNPMVTPATPKKFKTRSVGGGVNSGAAVDPGQPILQPVRYVTHMVLHEYRMWSNTEGKPLEAKLIAFEDLVAEAPKGAEEPKFAAPPAKPTVVRSGKVRLLVGKKPVEVALEKLSLADREFVALLEAAITKKAAGEKLVPRVIK
jgi:hypothetical protein